MQIFLTEQPSVGYFRCYGPFLLTIWLVALPGCGSKSKVDRVTVSGSVTYKGRPVPTGLIAFTPDFRQGNRGPQGIAKIVDGRYSTRDGLGKGSVTGPQRVEIRAFEGPESAPDDGDSLGIGNQLFRPYQTTVDVPVEGGTLDFVVPNGADSTRKKRSAR